MANKIGILTIHGLGNQKPDYDKVLRDKLLEQFSPELRKRVVFQTIFYQDQMQAQQADTWERMTTNVLDWRRLRQFLMYYFSDAITYQHAQNEPGSVYQKVNHKIRATLRQLESKIGPDAKIVVFANSLGCHVLSNYIYDAQNNKGIWRNRNDAPSKCEKLGGLRLLLTTGCNIPLFVAGLEKIEAFEKPSDNFQWFNYYDRDDVLGWPIKYLRKGDRNSYSDVVTADHEINTGFTPLSHLSYWKDSSFISPAVEKIEELE